MARDYYEVLGVPRSADEKEIRSAFRKMARQYHPDLNPGDESAERKFKEINEANEVLSDPDKRVKYNRHGDNWIHADRIEAQGGLARLRRQSKAHASNTASATWATLMTFSVASATHSVGHRHTEQALARTRGGAVAPVARTTTMYL